MRLPAQSVETLCDLSKQTLGYCASQNGFAEHFWIFRHIDIFDGVLIMVRLARQDSSDAADELFDKAEANSQNRKVRLLLGALPRLLSIPA